MTASNPLTRQVAGSHYVKLGMQPVVFATANRYDPCAFSILKYVTRWRDKNGIQDLQKARHFVELRMTANVSGFVVVYPANTGPTFDTIGAATYCRMNDLRKTEAEIVQTLDEWVLWSRALDNEKTAPARIIELLDQLISENGG